MAESAGEILGADWEGDERLRALTSQTVEGFVFGLV
jgi:hypothetical protein